MWTSAMASLATQTTPLAHSTSQRLRVSVVVQGLPLVEGKLRLLAQAYEPW